MSNPESHVQAAVWSTIGHLPGVRADERSKIGEVNQSSFVNDYIGQKFGLLTVLEQLPKGAFNQKHIMVRCLCDCGNTVVIRRGRLTERKGGPIACGCLRGKWQRHGLSNTKLYRVWDSMVRRCHNPNHRAYPSYGGRGIYVCDEWRDFCVFRDWAESSGYAEGLTIDRIDNDAGYSPSNCRWATRSQQSNNRRNSAWIEHEGRRLTVTEWSRELGIPVHRVRRYLAAQNVKP